MLEDDPDEAVTNDALLETVDLPAELGVLVEQLADLLEQASSPGTRRAYASDWADFRIGAGRHHLAALPGRALLAPGSHRAMAVAGYTYDSLPGDERAALPIAAELAAALGLPDAGQLPDPLSGPRGGASGPHYLT